MGITVCGVELDVNFKYHPPCRGYRNSFGVPEEPDEDAYIEILDITIGNQDVYELMEFAGLLDEIEEKCLLEYDDCQDVDFYEEDYYDYYEGV